MKAGNTDSELEDSLESSASALTVQPSSFTQHIFYTDIFDTAYAIRVLKMKDSVFIHVSNDENPVLDEMGLAMPFKNDEFIGTPIIGPMSECDSTEFAVKLSRKLNKQVFVSFNVSTIKLIRLDLERRIISEIKAKPHYF